MICSTLCPKGTKCTPLANVVETDEHGQTKPGGSLVCVGTHGEQKPEGLEGDIYRHCFRSAAGVDQVSDNNEYDLLSVVSVFSDALLTHNHLTQ